jgi:hypothetical protein
VNCAIGISVAAEKEELHAAEAELRAGIADLLSARRAFRGARRSRKARCRKLRLSQSRPPEAQAALTSARWTSRIKLRHKFKDAQSILQKNYYSN